MPELADTIIGMPTQLGIRTLQIERAIIQASRAATIHILFNLRVREAVQTLHDDPGDFVHPNQDLLPNQRLQEVRGAIQITLPEPLPVSPQHSPSTKDSDEYLGQHGYAYYSPTPSPPTTVDTPDTSSNPRTPSPDPLPLYERDMMPLPPLSLPIIKHVPPGP